MPTREAHERVQRLGLRARARLPPGLDADPGQLQRAFGREFELYQVAVGQLPGDDESRDHRDSPAVGHDPAQHRGRTGEHADPRERAEVAAELVQQVLRGAAVVRDHELGPHQHFPGQRTSGAGERVVRRGDQHDLVLADRRVRQRGRIAVVEQERDVDAPGREIVRDLALLRVLYPDPARRVRAVGSWAAVTTLGLSAGPALGGVLLAIDSPNAWRLIFLVNPPFALLGFVLIRGIGEPERGPRHAVDVAGLLLSIVGLGAATFGLIDSGSAGWTSPAVLAAIAVSALAFVALTLVERRAKAPALPPVLFSLSRVRTALGSALVTNYLWYGLWFLLAIWLQTVRHLSPLETGLFFIPAALPCSLVPPFTARAVNRYGARRVQVTGFALYALAAVLIVAVGADAPLWVYVVGALMFSLAAVQVVPAVTSEISVAAPERFAATGQGALYASRQAGSALGVAVVSAVGVTNLRGAAVALLVGAALALVLVAFGGRSSQGR